MKRLGAYLLTLLLVAGCGNTQSLAERQVSTQFDMTSYYAAPADVGQCQGAMTISGGIKYKCTQ